MNGAVSTPVCDLQTMRDIAAQNEIIQQENRSLRQQLDRFKRQLFGRKSEKRLIENPDQLTLADILGPDTPAATPPDTETITYTRRMGKQCVADCVTDSGLRFDPDVPIDTNHPERALRVIPGGEHVGIIQSLLTTCRLHGVDPCTWLVDVLLQIDLHPDRDIGEFTPRRWKELFAATPLRSGLYGLGK